MRTLGPIATNAATHHGERELDGGRRATSDMTWAEFVEVFIEKHAARKPASTSAAYQHCLNIFTAVGKPRYLTKVTHSLLEDFVTKRLKLGVAPATVNRDLRHIKAALRWAKRRDYLLDIPDFKGLFVKENRRKPIIIPDEDFLAMVKALRSPNLQLVHRSADWWRIFLYVAYYLGLRRGEILGLAWEQVRLDSLEISVLAATSKGRKERVVPMAPELGKLFQEWKDKNAPVRGRDEVLPWPHDNYRSLYDDWHAIQTAAGIPEGEHYVPKNCRSTCASALIASNVPTVVVKDFLGHATVTTTENYYINTKPALRAAASARKIQIEKPESEGDGESKSAK